MEIKPSRGFCLIEDLIPDEKSDNVYLPDRLQESQPKGIVLAVGLPAFLPNGAEYFPEFKAGDIVYHKKFTDNKIKDGDKELLLVPFGDVLAIING